MATVSKPKCTVCGKEVDVTGEFEIPYHVECVQKMFRERDKRQWWRKRAIVAK